MSRIRIPPVLRDVVGGARELEASGSTVGTVLDDLFDSHPALRDRLSEAGKLSAFVNVYVNDEDVRYLDQLDTKLADGDEVSILPAVAGGAA